jgi:hypothetical protein
LKKLQMTQKKLTKIYMNNLSIIALVKNPVFHDRSKYIDIRFHYLWDCIAKRKLKSSM